MHHLIAIIKMLFADLSLPSLPTVSTLANVPTHVGTAQSYTDDRQRLPIVVEQASLSSISRVQDSRPAVAGSAVHYAEFVRPTSTAYTAPLQSPSVHWRKQLVHDYVQPDTGLGVATHIAPPCILGISDHSLLSICKPCQLEKVI